MANKEPYDFLTTITADVDVTLSLVAQGEVSEESRTNVIVHIGDDESEERIIMSSTPVFYATFGWNILSESDSGTVLDLYHTSVQGMAKSFKWAHAGHTYVVRFDCVMERKGSAASRYGVPVRLKLLGRIVDA